MPAIKGTKVTTCQAEVYRMLESYGPIADHVLVPIAQHQMHVRQSSSGIRTRRSELESLGLVEKTGSMRTGSGRRAYLFGVCA